MPELVAGGFVYLAQPPLYKVTYKKKVEYLKDDAALSSYKKKHKEGTYSLQRYKGYEVVWPLSIFLVRQTRVM